MKTYPCSKPDVEPEYPLTYQSVISEEGVYQQQDFPSTYVIVIKNHERVSTLLCLDGGNLTVCSDMSMRKFRRVRDARVCMEIR